MAHLSSNVLGSCTRPTLISDTPHKIASNIPTKVKEIFVIKLMQFLYKVSKNCAGRDSVP